jgi:cell division septal protein FtsQ
MPVAAPADRRFRRAQVPLRRRPVLDFKTWRKIAMVLVAISAGVVGLYTAVNSVLGSLTITTVTVEGTERMSEGAVHEQLAALVGQPMFRVDLDQWRDQVRQLSWVQDAAIRRQLPGTVAVAITERQPLAIGRIGDSLNIIDRRGVIIDAFGPNYSDLDLPIIDGLAYPDESGLDQTGQARALLAVRLLSDLQRTPALAARLSEVDVSNLRNAIVVLKDDTTQLLLGYERFGERLQSYLDLAPTLREGVPNVDTVDLRYGARVFVRPADASRTSRTKRMGGEE